MIVQIPIQPYRSCSHDGNGLVETRNDTGDNPAIHQRNRKFFLVTCSPQIDNMSRQFFGSAFMSFMAVAYVPAYLEDRATFVKERANGLYGPASFLIANFLVGLPYLCECPSTLVHLTISATAATVQVTRIANNPSKSSSRLSFPSLPIGCPIFSRLRAPFLSGSCGSSSTLWPPNRLSCSCLRSFPTLSWPWRLSHLPMAYG